jgi:hypothetical protein
MIQLTPNAIVQLDPALPHVGGGICVVVEQEGDSVVCHAANDPEKKPVVILRKNVRIIGYLPQWGGVIPSR